MTITSKDYGYTQDGRKVKQFRLENSSGMSVSVIEYGCTVTNIRVKDKNGDLRDVVLGYDTLRDYERAGASMGAFVGRCANRIENARFEIDGVTTQLERNEGRNHLHGSFSRKLYESSIEDDKLVLRMNSPEGDDGFPGNMEVTVTYSLTEENSFVMEYSAVTDAPTLANFTNHSYFNLNGHDSGTVLGQKLRIASDTFTEIGEGLCTTGRFLPTGGTPFDFETEKEIRKLMPDCEFGRWHPTFVDITAKGNTKQKGMEHILEYFGMDVSETMAFGDGGNDIPMLRFAEIGVAMGNSSEEVQQHANYVTTSVDEDGIANALKHFHVI